MSNFHSKMFGSEAGRTVSLLVFAMLAWASSSNLAAEPDENAQALLIIGYDGSAWYPYRMQLSANESESWQKIKAMRNASHVSEDSNSQGLFYKSEDGRLSVYDLASESTVGSYFPCAGDAFATSYTQLRAHAGGLAMVELAQGKSRETDLVLLGMDSFSSPDSTDCQKTIASKPLSQASAQFHPLVRDQFLFYAHVSCRLSCDPIVQDVWRQNRATGRAEQLTLLNATSYLHSVDNSRQFGFISSNQHGYYHLARLNLETKELLWLTQGQVTDSYPSISAQGNLYYLRRSPSGTQLMKMPKSAVLSPNRGNKRDSSKAVALPDGVQKVRYLELSN